MFEPRLTVETLTAEPKRPRPAPMLGEMRDPRDVAPFEEWGHAVTAPDEPSSPRTPGMPPFTV